MLVLTRQENQRIRFPGLGIAVEILDIQGSRVRVGVEAPIEVRILRDELEDRGSQPERAASPPSQEERKTIRLPSTTRHELRNTLHELSLMMHVYRKQAQKSGGANGTDNLSPEQMCEAVIERLNDLSKHNALSKDGVSSIDQQDRDDTAESMGRALVVDDNDNERELMAGFLKMCGYEVVTASNGNAALNLLRKGESPDVILLDMQMPQCNGQEFLQQVRSADQWKPIHVFVVSGSRPKEYGLSKRDGYSHWFQKPLDPRQVVAKLDQIESPAVA